MDDNFVYGFNVLETLVRETPHRVVQVYIEKTRKDKRVTALKSMLSERGLSWQPISADKISRLVQDENHQGVVAEVRNAPVLGEKELFGHVEGLADPFLCVFEGVQDPRNLGACLRTAVAANVDMVILPRHDACAITPVARKAASGAAELITVARVSNLARVLTRLKQDAGIWIVGTDSDAAESLYDVTLAGPLAMVFGSEGSGLKRLTRDCCDFVASVPMSGSMDSLNVSVAVGVSLFEAVRQRRSGLGPAR